MTEDNKLFDLINDAEQALINDTPQQAAEAMEEIATMFAGIGAPQQFAEVRQHIIQSAAEKTSAIFVKEKLEAAESERQKRRLYG